MHAHYSYNFEINFLIILSEATKSMMTGRPIGLKISQNLNKNLTRGITNRKILNKILKDFERSDHIMRGWVGLRPQNYKKILAKASVTLTGCRAKKKNISARGQGPGGVGSVGYVEVAGHECGVVMLENFRTAFQRFPKHP